MKNFPGSTFLLRFWIAVSILVLWPGLARSAEPTVPPIVTAGDHAAALAQVFPAVVKIEAIRLEPDQGRMIKGRIGGSGVIISPKGYVLTNCHVAEDADYYRCYLADGTQVEAHRVGEDALSDLAVLQLDLASRPADAAPLTVASFGDPASVAAGETVFALGSPAFLSSSVTEGIVANASLVLPEDSPMILDGENVGTVVRWILHDARIYPGNSGGPLVDGQGLVIGINELGVAGLAGAIPVSVARQVAEQLIAYGHVTRGWSGLGVQPILEADGAGPGVIVADVAPGSPAAAAGIQPGDRIAACDGHAIDGEGEKAVQQFFRLEMGRLPGDEFAVDYDRAGQRQTARLALVTREPAEAEKEEIRAWGAVVTDLTRQLARNLRLPDEHGVFLGSIRPGGPCGQAEPQLRPQDVIVGVNGTPITDSAQLRTLTDSLLSGRTRRAVLVKVLRDGEAVASSVTLRSSTEAGQVTPQVRKAWLGVSSQPLMARLATALKIQAAGGARLTRIYPGTQAAAAGLQVGDVVLALDGVPLAERRAEDADMLDSQVRQYRPGTQAVFALWRDGQKLEVPVTLEEQPTRSAEMPLWEDDQLEFSARDLALEDRMRLQLAPDAAGALTQNVVLAGWASLAGLRDDDLVLQAGGAPVKTAAELRRSRDEAMQGARGWWVLLVQRRSQTLFIEINLKPIK